jgi:monoamine oxidase
MRFLSALAMVESIRGNFENGIGDYRIMDGYGAVVAGLAHGLDVRLSAPVAKVIHRSSGVRVELQDGERLDGDAAVITLPVGVLQCGSVAFAPELPESKRLSLRGLRMGPVIKLVFRFDRPIVEPHISAVYSANNPPMWWSPSFGHDSHAQVWTAFVSGDWAMELLSLDEDGALDAAVDALRDELDRDDFRVEDARLISWPDDPYSRGGYSFVLPGHDGARQSLAEPTPPLFWAGEATEPEGRAATVHGALESGIRAAHEVRSSLVAGSDRGHVPPGPNAGRRNGRTN